MVETQAVGRAHRLVQQKPDIVFCYVTTGTIEEVLSATPRKKTF
jgi:SNF2 family DNA or RNA helicase